MRSVPPETSTPPYPMASPLELTTPASTCDLDLWRRLVGMLSRSSSSSRRSLQAGFTPCFPSAEGRASLLESRSLPARPRKKAVFDPDACSRPIHEFDDQTHSAHFTPRHNGVDADLPAAQPDGFSDSYLMPSLTRNERLRLTMCE